MRCLRCFVCLVTAAGWISCARSAEPDVRRVIPANTAVLIEINRPMRLIETAFLRDLWAIARDSDALRNATTSPESDRLRHAARFIERSLETDWRTGVSRLTAGGVVIAVSVEKQGAEPNVTVVVTSDSEPTLQRFLEAVHSELRRRTPGGAAAELKDKPQPAPGANDKPAEPVATTYRSFTCYRVGNGHYAVVGRRLVASNGEPGLKAALDRLADPNIESVSKAAFRLPEGLRFDDPPGGKPVVQVTIDLRMLKQDPKTAEGLKLPANDLPAVFLLGGYIDLFRRADFVTAGLFVDDEGAEVRVRLPVGSDGTYPALRGFFASDGDESAAPPLSPPGTIYTASWYRDYSRYWEGKNELYGPAVVRQMEEDNAKQRQQTGGVGFGDLLQMLGPHFRAVAARPQENVYQTTLSERLPALGLAIDVRDEVRFREQVLTPLDRLVGAVVASKGAEFKTTDYRGSKVAAIRFSEQQAVTDPQQQVLYNFNPAYSLTRGHLVVGSTAEIVRGLIDELDRLDEASPDESTAAGPGQPRVTDVQRITFDDVGLLLKSFHPRFIRDAVERKGMSLADAESELKLMGRLFERLGSLSQTISVSPQQFDIRLRMGPAPTTK